VAWSNGQDELLDRCRFRPLAADRARAYLADLISDLLTGVRDGGGVATGVHAYLFPFEAVFEARTSKKRPPLIDAIESLRDTYFERGPKAAFSSVYGPVPDAVARHEPPAPDAAADMERRRFDLFFELFDGEEVTA
jgi:hypothetical protein